MREELRECQVLAMYDVRGIQSYIFKSNAAKEIIGASRLVDGIILEGFKEYLHTLEDSSGYLIDWKNDDPGAFLEDQKIEMQMMFIGGGNAYVLFRRGRECERVNQFLAKYVFERTYSLNLAVAVVEKTDSYRVDYETINEEMRRIKAGMTLSIPTGAMPFMAVDSVTGAPLTFKEKEGYFSTEAMLKRKALNGNENPDGERIFDNMVTEKGDSSTLAVFHIDGNSMGNRIKNEMEVTDGYREAVEKMRRLSSEISETFHNTVDKMKDYMKKLAPLVNDKKTLYRKIIVAGDDITFVCNAKLALPAVEYFLRHIGEEGNGQFSACGGIAYFNSHFPFSDAYQVAEACCDSAKKRAKREENQGDQDKTGSARIGNFLDFQVCTNISASDLEDYRDRHYRSEGGLFLARPYYVPVSTDQWNLNERNSAFSIDQLKHWMQYFCSMPRSKAKELRDAIPMGEAEIKEELDFLKSRGYSQLVYADHEVGVWYDALEIMDWYVREEE